MAVQPLEQEYDFHGYQAPIVQFQEPTAVQAATVEMAAPAVYGILDFNAEVDSLIRWEGRFTIEHSGTVNALRFITKNILAVVMEQSSTIDWLNHYLVLPLSKPVRVNADDTLIVRFEYRAGGSIPSLQAAMQVVVQGAASVEAADQPCLAYA